MDKPEQIVLQIYSEPLRRFQLAAEGQAHQPPTPNGAHPRFRAAAELVCAVWRFWSTPMVGRSPLTLSLSLKGRGTLSPEPSMLQSIAAAAK